jgi:hypothetical protein
MAGQEKPELSQVQEAAHNQGGQTVPQPHPSRATANGATVELEQRFRQLARTWIQETEYLSSTVQMAKHPAYQEIIGMGEVAIPLVLAELRRRPDFWFAALRAITGENPVPPQSAGKVQEMAKAWLEWGHARGYVR